MDSRELRFVNHGGSFSSPDDPDVVQGNINVTSPSTNGKCAPIIDGDVDHVQLLSSQLKSLLTSEDFTDVTFVVEGKI